MKSWNQPTDEMVGKALSTLKTEVDRQYFFSRLKNPLWIFPLKNSGYFNSPPSIKDLPDNMVQYPFWPELFFLKNVAEIAPQEVINIVLEIPKTDNPRIYDGIIEIALNIKGKISGELLPKIKEYATTKHLYFANHFPDLIKHWIHQSNVEEALELVKIIIPFQPDPEDQEKRAQFKEDEYNYYTTLHPSPRFNKWEYEQILKEGVCPLADRQPFQVARLLIDATSAMIRLKTHQKHLDKQIEGDGSEFWFERFDHPEKKYRDSKQVLVFALTYACEKVYHQNPDSIVALDQALRNQRWRIFKRLRQHLYALHPNEQTLPWIREFIINYGQYSEREYSYEFQKMLRKACEYFGSRLLNEDEKIKIFNAILSGPSKEEYRDWMKEHFTEESYLKRKKYFQLKQLWPFQSILNEDTKTYYEDLKEENKKINFIDKDYLHIIETKSGVITYESPKNIEELKKLSDKDILEYINKWDEKYHDKNDWLIEYNISGLAKEFQLFFKEIIISDDMRLELWLKQKEKIKRPIYISAILKSIKEHIKENNFDKLGQWFEFCDWVLAHQEVERNENEPPSSDESIELPDWGRSRREVVEFINLCISDDVNIPTTARDSIINLLSKLCTQFDAQLDSKKSIYKDFDPIDQAINSTRGRAFEALINYALWLRKKLPDNSLVEITKIIENRLSENVENKLTIPEYAILGMRFGNIVFLNNNWALLHKKALFPLNNKLIWQSAFEGYLNYNNASLSVYMILKEDYQFAVSIINEKIINQNDTYDQFIHKLGQDIFRLYLWEVYPLTGNESLLEKFYLETNSERKYWAGLFDEIGRTIKNSGSYLENELIVKIKEFFEWRLEQGEEKELQEFTHWLDAECLDPDWRLDAYSRVLDTIKSKKGGLSLELEPLNKLFQNHLSKVVECFAKITDFLDRESNLYISAEDAKPILKAGLKSKDEQVLINAERAREKLLRIGRFDFLDLE